MSRQSEVGALRHFENIRQRLAVANDLENAPLLAREIEAMLSEVERECIFLLEQARRFAQYVEHHSVGEDEIAAAQQFLRETDKSESAPIWKSELPHGFIMREIDDLDSPDSGSKGCLPPESAYIVVPEEFAGHPVCVHYEHEKGITVRESLGVLNYEFEWFLTQGPIFTDEWATHPEAAICLFYRYEKDNRWIKKPSIQSDVPAQKS